MLVVPEPCLGFFCPISGGAQLCQLLLAFSGQFAVPGQSRNAGGNVDVSQSGSQLFPEEYEPWAVYWGQLALLCLGGKVPGLCLCVNRVSLWEPSSPNNWGSIRVVFWNRVFRGGYGWKWGDLIAFINFVSCPTRDCKLRVLNNPQQTQGMLSLS